MDSPTYIIAVFQERLETWIHIVMVHRHKEGIHDNAQRDEEFHKGVKDDDGTELLEINPACAAVPNAADINALQALGHAPVFELRLFFLLLLSFCWKIIDGH